MGTFRIKKKFKSKYTKQTIYDDLKTTNNQEAVEFKQRAREKVAVISSKTTTKKVFTISRGEKRVMMFLKLRRVEYETEKKFIGMVSPITKGSLRLDFYLPRLGIAIEFDGIQHFKKVKGFDTDKYTLETRQANDKAKDDYCYNNAIKLIRIHYKDYSEIEIILTKELFD